MHEAITEFGADGPVRGPSKEGKETREGEGFSKRIREAMKQRKENERGSSMQNEALEEGTESRDTPLKFGLIITKKSAKNGEAPVTDGSTEEGASRAGQSSAASDARLPDSADQEALDSLLDPDSRPPTGTNRRGLTATADTDDPLGRDIRHAADDQGLAEYERFPVEDFGLRFLGLKREDLEREKAPYMKNLARGRHREGAGLGAKLDDRPPTHHRPGHRPSAADYARDRHERREEREQRERERERKRDRDRGHRDDDSRRHRTEEHRSSRDDRGSSGDHRSSRDHRRDARD